MRMALSTGRVDEHCVATASAGIWAALIFLNIPMCPFRPHGVTGLARGDMYKRLRAAWGGRGGWEWEEPPPHAIAEASA